jgi:hypothetical protein
MLQIIIGGVIIILLAISTTLGFVTSLKDNALDKKLTEISKNLVEIQAKVNEANELTETFIKNSEASKEGEHKEGAHKAESGAKEQPVEQGHDDHGAQPSKGKSKGQDAEHGAKPAKGHDGEHGAKKESADTKQGAGATKSEVKKPAASH